MRPGNVERQIISHYTKGNTRERILTALDLHGAAPGSVSVDMLFPVDQLHHGGITLTAKMAEVAGKTRNMRILDAGSGIGGAARSLAHRFDCDVETVDLSGEFIRTASDMDELVGLTGKIAQSVGLVTEVPFESERFDIVRSQNVTINVPDKRAMFTEEKRVLKRGGVFVLPHFDKRNGATLDYPVPWAMMEETCFAISPEELLQTLFDTGFDRAVDPSEGAPAAPSPPMPSGQPDDSLAMGRTCHNVGRVPAGW